MNPVSRTVHKEATPRCAHVSANYGRYIIVWGGYATEGSFQYYLPPDELWVYCTENKLWHCLKSDPHCCPYELSGACCSCHGDSLYIFGGHGGLGNSNKLYCLDLKTYTWMVIETELSPSPRDKAVSWFYDKKFYCFSGFGPSIDGYIADNGSYTEDIESNTFPRRGWNNQLLIYDTEKGEWTNPRCKGDVPLPRAAAAVCRVGSDVYLFGGRHKSTRMNDLHVLDLIELKWTELRPVGCLPCGRSWHTLTAVSNQRLFLYGGFDQNNTTLSDGWIFNISTLNWCKLDYLPGDRPRLWHTANLSPDGEVIIYGGCHNNILDYTISDKITGELVKIQLAPFSLLRLCLDEVYKRQFETHCYWEELPQSLCHWLQEKHRLELLCNSYDSDSDNDTNDQGNEQGLSCSIS